MNAQRKYRTLQTLRARDLVIEAEIIAALSAAGEDERCEFQRLCCTRYHTHTQRKRDIAQIAPRRWLV